MLQAKRHGVPAVAFDFASAGHQELGIAAQRNHRIEHRGKPLAIEFVPDEQQHGNVPRQAESLTHQPAIRGIGTKAR